MAGHALLVHPDVDSWVRERTDLRRRVDWLLFELATRGEAGRSKGIVGPAARVADRPDARWRRSGVGGFHYYAWWFAAGGRGEAAGNGTNGHRVESDDEIGPGAVVVRAIRHHDEMGPLAAGASAAYRPRAATELDPLTEEQAPVLQSTARVRLVVGQPGTGKTGALIFAAVREGAALPPNAHLLYVTLSRRLAALAEEYLAGVSGLGRRVRVVPLADLLEEWGRTKGAGAGRRGEPPAATEEDEERAFLGSVAGFAPRELAIWQGSARALWAEVRAHVIGATLPFPLRDRPAATGPILDEWSYRRAREGLLGAKATQAAWQVARTFAERRDLPSVQRAARAALERLAAGKLDRQLASLGGLIVDEIQDLTLLQIAALAEAARRAGGGDTSHLPPPIFVAAGDESQIVHPSGFDWGRCKDLLAARLGGQPEEIVLRTNQRSPAPLIEVGNRTSLLYDELPREFRPRGSARAEKTEAANGEVVLVTVPRHDADHAAADQSQDGPDDELGGWLARLADTPHTAIVVDDESRRELTRDSRLATRDLSDVLFTPDEIKGLDRQYVVIWDASRALASVREQIAAGRGRGQQLRFLVARTAIDELRVAVSRATETLVFLDFSDVDRPDAEFDPLLAGLLEDGQARARSVAFLRDRIEERNADPRERAIGFLDDAAELLEGDLDRAVRTLVRVEAALAELVDPVGRREPLERAAVVREQAAAELVRRGRYAEAAEQLEKLALVSGELSAPGADRFAVLARRYREAPPEADLIATPPSAERLAELLPAYLGAIEALPAEDRPARLYAEPRAWLAEARGSASAGSDQASSRASRERSLYESARRLAVLTDAAADREMAAALRAALVERSLATGDWRAALALLEEGPDPPPEQLARCHEGLGAWGEAARARLAAGQPAAALEDYRRAADFAAAAELAATLDRPDLAATLGSLAELNAALDHLRAADLDAVTAAETAALARALREAADLVTRRRPKPRGTGFR